MLTRVALIATAVVIATAAPLRVWCEASCLAPAHHAESSKSHCPTPAPSDEGTSLSASSLDECPVLESARTPSTKSDFARATPALTWQSVLAPVVSALPGRPSTAALRHASHTPLRI